MAWPVTWRPRRARTTLQVVAPIAQDVIETEAVSSWSGAGRPDRTRDGGELWHCQLSLRRIRRRSLSLAWRSRPSRASPSGAADGVRAPRETSRHGGRAGYRLDCSVQSPHAGIRQAMPHSLPAPRHTQTSRSGAAFHASRYGAGAAKSCAACPTTTRQAAPSGLSMASGSLSRHAEHPTAMPSQIHQGCLGD